MAPAIAPALPYFPRVSDSLERSAPRTLDRRGGISMKFVIKGPGNTTLSLRMRQEALIVGWLAGD